MRLSRPAALAVLGFLLAAPALAEIATPNTTAKPPGTTTAPTTQPSAAQAAQQERMAACNAQSGQTKLSGDKRKSFMTSCLAGRLLLASGVLSGRGAGSRRAGLLIG